MVTMSRLPLVLVLLALAGSVSPALSAPGDIRATLMAARSDWSAREFSGYAFLCFEAEGASDVDADCYGFYQGDGNKGFAGGAANSVATLKRNPTKFPRPAIAVSRPATAAQRQAVATLVDEWNAREYELTPVSTMELVRASAQALGFAMPPPKKESPEDFLKRLRTFNR